MNRKQVLSSVTITAIATILLAWAPSAAYAGNPNAATVITDFGCVLFETGGAPGFTTDTHVVSNKNNVKFTCHFTGLDPQSPAHIEKGFLCSTQFGLTSNTMAVVDDEGNGMLRCIIHNNP